MKIRVWLDSGANIHSRREDVFDLEELGFTDEEWAAMSEDERFNEIQPIAFERMDWGYEEVK